MSLSHHREQRLSRLLLLQRSLPRQGGRERKPVGRQLLQQLKRLVRQETDTLVCALLIEIFDLDLDCYLGLKGATESSLWALHFNVSQRVKESSASKDWSFYRLVQMKDSGRLLRLLE
jgi:hypothetical protein